MSAGAVLTELSQQGGRLWLDGDRLRVRAAEGVLTGELRARIAEHRAEIVSLLRRHEASRDLEPLPALVPDHAHRHDPFPLTDIQQAYWVGRSGLFELGNVGCHGYYEFEFTDLDLERLNAAWQQVVARHDMLRAIVLPDGRQRVLERVPAYEIDVLDLRHAPPEVIDARLAAIRDSLSHEVRAPEEWPLFELRATRLDDRRTRLHVSFDLLIADAASGFLLAIECRDLYQDPAAALAPLELSFRDHVVAEAALRGSPRHRRSQEYWRARVPDLPPAPELPLAQSAATLEQPRFVRRTGRLAAAAWSRLKARAARAGLTPSGILLAAYAEALATWSKTARFTINLTFFNRLPLHPQVYSLVGDFTSVSLLAVDHSRHEPFETRARRVQEQVWSDLDHGYVSGVSVMREVARAQGWGTRAVGAVVFTSFLNQYMRSEDALPYDWLGELVYGISQTPQVLVDHQAMEQRGDLVWNWDSVDALFPDGVLDDLFAAYGRLLEALAGDEASWARPCALVPPAQLAARAAVNATAAPIPEGLLHAGFDAHASVRPDAPAVVCSERTLGYGELRRRARALAHRLRAAGARPNELVAVAMHKGWEQVVAVLAVLEAGAAYLPVDPALPPARRQHLLERGRARLVVTQPALAASSTWPAGLDVLTVAADDSLADGDDPLPAVQTPDDLAYVIFTSGSTGTPKGVMISHRGALNTIADVNRRFAVGPADRVLALSSLAFDLSVYDVFGTLAAGAALVIPDAASTRDPAHWAAWLAREHVTIWNSVPALMEMLVEEVADRADTPAASLRLALLSGDWIPPTLPDRVRACAPAAAVVSLGGATEASIWSIVRPVERVEPGWRSIPYGRPLTNQTFHVLNEALEPCPVWVSGQLYIGGVGLAEGYWDDAEKTERAFFTHPRTGERLYRTGDVGRYLPDGEIEFLGRDDFQVKIRGHRVELEEIEAALLQHPGVRAAAVAAVGEPRGSKRLVAYVVPARGDGAEPTAGGDLIPPADTGGLLLDPLARLDFKLARHGLRRDLPGPALPLHRPPDAELVALHTERRTHRTFLATPVSREALAALLAALIEVEDPRFPFPKLRYPSAGESYPVQAYVYVAPDRVADVAPGLYYHDPSAHRLVTVDPGARIGPEIHVLQNQPIAAQSAFAIFLVARLAAIEPLYGPLARDFALLEAGAMCQLLMTVAPESGLGLCPIGTLAFDPVRSHFALEERDELLHSLVGGCVGDGVPSAPAPSAGPGGLESELQRFLGERLPSYMVPTTVALLDALPLTPNGKVDRAALPDAESLRAEREYTAPETGLEETLAGLVQEVLGIERVGTLENFFDLGANSVHLVQLQRRLQEAGTPTRSVVELFHHPTIRALARHLQGDDERPSVRSRVAERAERQRASVGRDAPGRRRDRSDAGPHD